jgi:hypothetical protein
VHAKKMFIVSNTEKTQTARKTIGAQSRRSYTYKYNFNVINEVIKVCREFYLGTLDISEKPVYTAHKNKDETTGLPAVSKKGLHPKKMIPEPQKQQIRDHIESFPKMESHYCRMTTRREYLEAHLNISKMYDLYKEKQIQEGKTVVKKNIYDKIFNTEYNLAFHIPKSDRCDTCEAFLVASQNQGLSEKETLDHNAHLAEKTAMRAERQRDRDDKDVAVLSFDLQNVVTCPRAEISCFFYYRKLNLYNLTAHLSTTKQGYCAIWTEAEMGRSGNELASAIINVLEKVMEEHPTLQDITCWSDSCVPQNRNSHLAYAVMIFLKANPNIRSVTFKYSTPGHSCIQEVDNIHSNIEKAMSVSEFYSPVSFLRIMLKVNRKKPYHIIQMHRDKFKDYQSCAKQLNFKLIPFTKEVVALKFTQSLFEIDFKTSHMDEDWIKVNVKFADRSKRSGGGQQLLPNPKVAAKRTEISAEKVGAIRSMMRWMPLVDRQYYTALFPAIGQV